MQIYMCLYICIILYTHSWQQPQSCPLRVRACVCVCERARAGCVTILMTYLMHMNEYTHTTNWQEHESFVYTATYCNTPQLTATHCNTLQFTNVTHCNTLQFTNVLSKWSCVYILSVKSAFTPTRPSLDPVPQKRHRHRDTRHRHRDTETKRQRQMQRQRQRQKQRQRQRHRYRCR